MSQAASTSFQAPSVPGAEWRPLLSAATANDRLTGAAITFACAVIFAGCAGGAAIAVCLARNGAGTCAAASSCAAVVVVAAALSVVFASRRAARAARPHWEARL